MSTIRAAQAACAYRVQPGGAPRARCGNCRHAQSIRTGWHGRESSALRCQRHWFLVAERGFCTDHLESPHA